MRTQLPILLAPIALLACSETGIGSERDPVPPPEPRVEYGDVNAPHVDTGSVDVPDIWIPEESSCDLGSVDPGTVAVSECRERGGELRFTEKWRWESPSDYRDLHGIASIVSADLAGNARGTSVIWVHDEPDPGRERRMVGLDGRDGSVADVMHIDTWSGVFNGQWVLATDDTGLRPGGFYQQTTSSSDSVERLSWRLDGRIDSYFAVSLPHPNEHPPSFASLSGGGSALRSRSAALLDVSGDGYADLLYGGRWASADGSGTLFPPSALLAYPPKPGAEGRYQVGLPDRKSTRLNSSHYS
mgnify:CR=1 FL=1